MKKLYVTKMINTGGRAGEVHSPDHSFEMQIVQPGKKVDGASNPEQLFAAGYAACFNGALAAVLDHHGVQAQATISASVSLYSVSDAALPDVQLGVEIEGHLDGIDLDQAQAYMDQAHTVCPYSKATNGNIEVTVKAV